MEVVLGGIWGTVCRFPGKSLMVGLCTLVGGGEVQAKGQSWSSLCGAKVLVQKSEFGVQRLKTWLAASASFLQLD